MKKHLFIIMTIIFSVFFLISCGKEKKETNNGANVTSSGEKETYTVTFDTDGGSTIPSQQVEDGKKITKPSKPTKEGYTFDDWYFQDEVWSFIGYVVTEDMTLTAKWNINYYNLDLNVNNPKAGTIITNSGSHYYNESITLEAKTNSGYTFIGWYDGDELISLYPSYNFKMPAKDLLYTAKWVANKDTPYKVEHYKENTDGTFTSIPNDVDNLKGETDTLTNIKPKNYDGYNTPEITQVNIDGDGKVVIKLFYELKRYNVSSNISNAADIIGAGSHKIGEKVNIQIKPYLAYEYDGIYINNHFVTKDLSYEIDNIADDIEIRFSVKSGLDNFTFESTIDTLIITGVIDNSITSFTVPTIVTNISKGAFSECSSLEEIYLPFIGGSKTNNTYLGYIFGVESNLDVPSTLKEVNIMSGGITSIDVGLLSNCKSLTNISISSDVETIALGAFEGCSSLDMMQLPFVGDKMHTAEDTYQYPFGYIFGEGNTEGEIADGFITIKQSYYGDNTSSPTTSLYNIPLSLKTIIVYHTPYIQYGAFSNCNTLSGIILTEAVESIGNYAFKNCSTLDFVKMSDMLKYIGDYAFSGCSSLTGITLPSSLTSISSGLFNLCSSLEVIVVRSNIIESIGFYAFQGCNSLENITIPNSVKNIYAYAFADCTSLTNITIPDSVETIGSNIFHGCSSLESISIPFIGYKRYESTDTYQYPLGYIFGAVTFNGAVEVSQYYYGTNNTSGIVNTKYYIPETLKTVILTDCDYIQIGAFYDCSKIENISIPSSVKYINNNAFSACFALLNVYYDGTIEDWCNISISSSMSNPMCYDACLYILDSNGDIEFNGKTYSMPTILTIPSTLTSIGSFQFSSFNQLTSIIIPSNVTSIGSFAFENCSSLESIEISSSVTNIGKYAFLKCVLLKSVTIPSSVTIIGQSAFEGCSSLETLEIPNGVTTIEMSAFNSCSSLTSVDIPNSVTSLLTGAFAYCSSLKTITIPNSINNIGNAIFYGCTELENVYFDGSIDDWNNNFKNSDLNPMQYASNLYILDSNGNIEYNGKKYYKATI